MGIETSNKVLLYQEAEPGVNAWTGMNPNS